MKPRERHPDDRLAPSLTVCTVVLINDDLATGSCHDAAGPARPQLSSFFTLCETNRLSGAEVQRYSA
jgi:hypothetical protein